MARRPTSKRLHYVRAVYTRANRPQENFASLVRRALQQLPHVADTKVAIRTMGVVGVRQRHADWENVAEPLRIAIGAGAPGESIGTFGADTVAVHDLDAPEAPPVDRAFKLADAFVLIDEDELIICTDGAMRGYSMVARYLRDLFSQANLPPNTQTFDFEPASNQEKRRTLELEGVREMKLKGTLYAATRELDGDEPQGLTAAWRRFRRGVQGLFTEEAEDDQQRAILAGHWGDFNITTTIAPVGGSRAEPVVLTTLDDAAMDVIDEIPDDSEVVIKTRQGNEIRSGDVILTKQVRLGRKDGQNDLDHIEVWDELQTFRSELRQRGAWQR
ncbi:hypothetical protein AAGT95_09480 [Salinicola lusitanus]|uniref:Uncharacterized protein n=1 Tax=Salinicola lusitanus TaxID=1949085 RepID=A0ABZ3CYL5_9GAMM